MRRIVVLLLIVGLFAAGGYAWYAHGASRHEAPFRTEEAARGDLLASFSATGTLEPEDIIDVGAQVAGQIKAFGPDLDQDGKPRLDKDGKPRPIDYGSEVPEGAVLARIDDSLYQAKVNQSKALVAVARAAVEQAVAKVDDANAAVKVAQANLQTAQVNFDHARRDWDRAQVLGPKQALAPADYDAYQSSFESTRAIVAQNEAALAQARVQVKEAEAAASNAKANVSAAEAAQSQDEINLGYTTIKAPVKGAIIDRRVTLGQTVQSSFNTPSLFLLARDLKRMKVWASVNEADIGQVHLGQAVKFLVDAYPGEVFTGTVGLVRLNATMTNNVVTYTVEVVTDNPVDKDHPNGKLLPYLTANLTFQVSERKDVLTLSNEALRWKPDVKQVAPDARAAFQKAMSRKGDGAEGGDKAAKEGGEAKTGKEGGPQRRGVVWVPDGEYVRPVKVKLGLSDGTRTEIVGGDLAEGAAVVLGDALQQGGNDGGSNPFTPQMFGGKKQ